MSRMQGWPCCVDDEFRSVADIFGSSRQFGQRNNDYASAVAQQTTSVGCAEEVEVMSAMA